jgi:sodium/pantothenate symporter
MNVYLLGMAISMLVYIVIGIIVSAKVKNANDFYVAGRQAPLLLIAGSMIASYTSTGMFMGDAAQCYDGVFSPIIIFAGMQSAGYIIGAVFFGRYLRRMKVFTIPEFFGKRFASKSMRVLATIVAIVTMTVYLLSVMQGIGTLMNEVTGVDYNFCITIALVVFTFLSVTGGSKGVLITDTLMAGLFTIGMVIACLFISNNAGGWFDALTTLASNPETSDALSATGRLDGTLYHDGASNIVWGLVYGVVWMSVCMVGPWQSSRYLMAKNETVVVKSAFWAAIGVFALEFLVGASAVFVNVVNPNMPDSSRVMIWAAMNMMPKLLGIILLTGVLAAGISSATTFLSLIGTSVSLDIIGKKGKGDKQTIMIGRIAMVLIAVVVLLLATFNPPSIFWIMFLGGAIIASSWMPVALASIFSKRLTRSAAFAGMLAGFLGCFVLRLYASLSGTSLPVYFDPALVGIVLNVVAMLIVTMLTKVTPEETEARAEMFILPKSEYSVGRAKGVILSTKRSMLIGVGIAVALLILWIIPYLSNKI